MFKWFWKFLYLISKFLMKVCDWITQCARMLIGIDYITVNDEKTDFLTYLIRSESVKKAFGVCFILAIIILVIFTIFAILRTYGKEQNNSTPAQIGVKAFKNVITFLMVPLIMLVLVYFLNTFMKAIYEATAGGSSSIGSFLFVTFSGDNNLSSDDAARFIDGTYDYYNYSTVDSCLRDLSDFNFIASWIVSGVVAYYLVSSLVSFIERAISIVILYIAAPFCIASSVLDDGARFKTWRDQVLVKFLASYGIIIALNIYIMICGLVMSTSVKFFESSSVLNKVIKILIIIGGAGTLRKIHTLIANLISTSAAGDVNDPANQTGRMMGQKLASGILKHNPVSEAARFVGGAAKDAAARKLDNMKQKLGNSMLNKLGIDTSYDTNRLNGTYGGKGGSDAENNNQAKYNENQNELNDALQNNNSNNGDNENANSPVNDNNNIVSDAINNGGGNDNKNNNDNKDE